MAKRAGHAGLFSPTFVVAFATLLVLVILFAGEPTPFAQVLAASSIAVVAGHAVLALGVRDAAVFLAICLVVTFGIENAGTVTGIPFGRYHFVVGAGLPHVGRIPLIVGFLYFGIGYPAWIISGLILRSAGARTADLYDVVAMPIVATFVTVQWDIAMDPSNATLGGLWVWHDGGGYFGVPLSNFVGWNLTVWIFFFLYGLYEYATRRSASARHPRPARFWLVPILLYLAAGLCLVTPYLHGVRSIVRDGGGGIWNAADIRESAVIVMTGTMLASSVVALLRLWDEARGTKAEANADDGPPLASSTPAAPFEPSSQS